MKYAKTSSLGLLKEDYIFISQNDSPELFKNSNNKKKLSKGSGLGKFNNSHMKQITELVKQKQLLEPQYVNDLVRFRVGGV